MKSENPFSRYTLLWAIIICYLIPLVALSAYGTLIPREFTDWNILSIGIFLTSFGTLILFWLMTQWEKSLNFQPQDLIEKQYHNTSDSSPFVNNGITIDPKDYDFAKRALEEAQQTQIRLLEEIDTLTEELRQNSFNKENNLLQNSKIQSELEQTKRGARHQLEQQQTQIRELQDALADQVDLNEKKQQQIFQLETKVGDLTYEIKTLLQFAEAHSGPLLSSEDFIPIPPEPVHNQTKIELPKETLSSDSPNLTQTCQEASLLLSQCLDIAQKIKGSQRFGSQIYSFLDSPADSFSLDLRRLCDRLRSEVDGAILLYSPKDNHLLFASNQIKSLTGWSPEKFTQNFSEILLEESEWKLGINSLAMRSEAQIQLHLKTKGGSPCIANANLGMIPSGIFRNHTIAVLYSNSTLIQKI